MRAASTKRKPRGFAPGGDVVEDLPVTADVERLGAALAKLILADLRNHPTLDEDAEPGAR